MTIIGVTGGIGSGKSAVSAILKELGAEVIDADLISHQVVEPGKRAWHLIVESFGQEVLKVDQTLDRRKLAAQVFHDKALRLKLESIIHTEVVRTMRQQLQDLAQEDFEGIVVLDVPIPVEHGFLDTVDQVWVVEAAEEVRIKRVMERSGLTAEEAKSRIQSQLSQKEYAKLADVIIKNEGSLKDLEQRVTDLVNTLRQ
ncbi:MAG: dephospho-CoA kinase [Clostridia bacterium]|nr:dephospho-CoA kinase [Clostridia bacterium]